MKLLGNSADTLPRLKPARTSIQIEAGNGIRLDGSLNVPDGAKGIVLFAHGSGSSRHSPRNVFVAGALRSSNLATLLLDLLTRDEDIDFEARFDIALLAERLCIATRWLMADDRTKSLKIGYFGASTGAAAAINAAIEMGDTVASIVSRGGRPDLSGNNLGRLKTPTLFIVGGADGVVLDLNRMAFARLLCEKDLVIVPRATHLFEEPGALEEVAKLATIWFKNYFDK
ncbi:MAG: alpha/beta hydrolase [Deltaproteobacteria bacterium]|nr:alpha/beta hydrolase [Deltaproteobacteria bacterium]